MKRVYQSFTLAMSMYSRIPMPRVEWQPEAMTHVFCFFPLVGIGVALCQVLWIALAGVLQIGGLLFAVGMVSIDLAITGGIHLDGFCDTCDALGSYQSRERRLEILKDSHIGAFALMGCCLYLLLAVALWDAVSLSGQGIWTVVCIPVLTRILSGLCSIYMKNARGSGMLDTFSDASDRKTVTRVLAVWLGLLCVVLWALGGLSGMGAILGAGITLAYFVRMANREFGGITGDLAGWFLQVCQVFCLLMVVLVQKASVLF